MIIIIIISKNRKKPRNINLGLTEKLVFWRLIAVF